MNFTSIEDRVITAATDAATTANRQPLAPQAGPATIPLGAQYFVSGTAPAMQEVIPPSPTTVPKPVP